VSALLDAPATPAVRKPAFEVTFGSAGADAWSRAVETVTLEAGFAPAVDSVEIVLSGRSDAPTVALDDSGTVSLGFDDDGAKKVFTGTVRAVHRTVAGKTRVVATNVGGVLAAYRVDNAYRQQGADAIVKDLAQRAGVKMGNISGGDAGDLASYVVDSRRSAWDHVARLGALDGPDAWVDADGALQYDTPSNGSSVQTFHYGKDVLALDVVEMPARIGSAKVVGEGAAGSKGSDAWSWNLKDAASVTASSGSGDPAVLVSAGAARSTQAAQAVADTLVKRAELGKVEGRLFVPGAPAAGVGTVVTVADAPDGSLNGDWLVCGVRHRLVKSAGYTSLLIVRRIS
jgi:hypothetical protein